MWWTIEERRHDDENNPATATDSHSRHTHAHIRILAYRARLLLFGGGTRVEATRPLLPAKLLRRPGPSGKGPLVQIARTRYGSPRTHLKKTTQHRNLHIIPYPPRGLPYRNQGCPSSLRRMLARIMFRRDDPVDEATPRPWRIRSCRNHPHTTSQPSALTAPISRGRYRCGFDVIGRGPPLRFHAILAFFVSLGDPTAADYFA